jgi:hypothetical protein
VSEKLREAFDNRDPQLTEKEREKMSFVSKIFVNSDYVLVIYKGPAKEGNSSNFILQLYNLQGRYLGEAPIPGQPGERMSFDKDKNILYSLSRDSSNRIARYFIAKYFISREGLLKK